MMSKPNKKERNFSYAPGLHLLNDDYSHQFSLNTKKDTPVKRDEVILTLLN